jgi:hypothetical protein
MPSITKDCMSPSDAFCRLLAPSNTKKRIFFMKLHHRKSVQTPSKSLVGHRCPVSRLASPPDATQRRLMSPNVAHCRLTTLKMCSMAGTPLDSSGHLRTPLDTKKRILFIKSRCDQERQNRRKIKLDPSKSTPASSTALDFFKLY